MQYEVNNFNVQFWLQGSASAQHMNGRGWQENTEALHLPRNILFPGYRHLWFFYVTTLRLHKHVYQPPRSEYFIAVIQFITTSHHVQTGIELNQPPIQKGPKL